jgi:hypothetical protein
MTFLPPVVLENLDCLPVLHLTLAACLCRKMPAKKGKVEQVPPGNDSPKGVYMFVVVVVVVVVVVERERERERERESYLL